MQEIKRIYHFMLIARVTGNKASAFAAREIANSEVDGNYVFTSLDHGWIKYGSEHKK